MKKLLLITTCIVIFVACESKDSNSEKNVGLVERYVDAVQNLDYDLMDTFLSDDYMGYGPSTNDSINKDDAVSQWKENVDKLYEKIEYKKSRSIAVTVKEGVNMGEWVSNWAQLEIAYKNDDQSVTIWANSIYKIDNGKISRSFTFYNEADVMEQLGYIFINPDNL
ncbi:MAG: nuclear transport factor 2 family protein [Flavobacteriaceae bacterium]